jgi:hypothetical protein
LVGASGAAPLAAQKFAGFRSLKEAEFEVRGMT